MEKITIETKVNAPIDTVWKCWNEPVHIMEWAHASSDWYAPHAENDLKEGGRFVTTMAARDGSVQFDFGGTYTSVIPHELIAYTMDDGRTVVVRFVEEDDGVQITESFDPESENSVEMQKSGWQSILNNFKSYTESR